MASLNQIAEHIASVFDNQNNEVLKDNIKFLVRINASLLMKREFEKNNNNMFFIQKYEAELTKVDATDSCITSSIDSNCLILKTKNKIPTPVKLGNGNPFLFVGNQTKDIIFTYGKKEQMKFMKHLKFAGNAYFYEYLDNHIYIYNASKLKHIRIEAKYDQIVSDYCNKQGGNCVTDDDEFPCPNDILAQVIDIIKKGGLAAIPNDSKIEINQEENDNK